MEDQSQSYEESINRAAGAIHRFPLVEVQGVPLMNLIAESWSSISAFQPDPSDLLIATYPKAGKTLHTCPKLGHYYLATIPEIGSNLYLSLSATVLNFLAISVTNFTW